MQAPPSVVVESLTAVVELAGADGGSQRQLTPDGGAPHLPGSFVLILPDTALDVTLALSGIDAVGNSLLASAQARSVPYHQVALTMVLGEPTGDGGVEIPFVPSHVSPSDFAKGGGAQLTVTSAIDTSALTVDSEPVLRGSFFVEDGLAVLAVQDLAIPVGATVRVIGSRPLVIVTSNAITIDGVLDGSAHGIAPGAGGSAPGAGPSPGKPGIRQGTGTNSGVGGGSGAGYGFDGGHAGSDTCTGGVMSARVPGGTAVGDAMLTQLAGGSGGGDGNHADCSPSANAVGGAGGGAIQLTAKAGVTVNGKISVGGGGGQGGCYTPSGSSGSGAGGGAGGSILIEALSLTFGALAVLAANGGAGGGGGYDTPGNPGADASPSAMAAPGGVAGNGGIPVDNGGVGGTLGAGGSSMDDPSCGVIGGGGGSSGRIYLRSRGPATLGGSVISPAPTVTQDL